MNALLCLVLSVWAVPAKRGVWCSLSLVDGTEVKAQLVGDEFLHYYVSEDADVAAKEKALQREWFVRQMDVAYRTGMPVIIHSRDACQDTINILKETHGEQTGGIIHCYSYTKEAAREYLNMGFHIGIGGVLTFKNARKLVEAAEYIPMDRIVLETDSPYMAPEPNRGKRNDSRNIIYVAEKLAQIKKMDVQEVIDITNENARRLFGLA